MIIISIAQIYVLISTFYTYIRIVLMCVVNVLELYTRILVSHSFYLLRLC